MNTPRGRFIVLEGIDGSGKTTQIEALRQWLPTSGLMHLPHLSRISYGLPRHQRKSRSSLGPLLVVLPRVWIRRAVRMP